MILSAQSIRKRGIFTPFSERTKEFGMSYGLSSAGRSLFERLDSGRLEVMERCPRFRIRREFRRRYRSRRESERGMTETADLGRSLPRKNSVER